MRRPSAVKASQAPSGWWTGRNQAGTSTSTPLGSDIGCQSASAVVEGAADVHDVDAQAVEQLVRGLGELLDDVVDPSPLVAQAEVPHEVGVRDRGDARAGRGAQVHRQHGPAHGARPRPGRARGRS